MKTYPTSNTNENNKKRFRQPNIASFSKNMTRSPYASRLTIIILMLALCLTTLINPAYAEDQTLDIVSIDNNIIIKTTAENNSKAFTDLSGHWAAASVQSLVQKGAIAGYADGSFKPDNEISRAEFATVLVKAFKLNIQSGKVFNDTQNH